jgi:hypothetical protein
MALARSTVLLLFLGLVSGACDDSDHRSPPPRGAGSSGGPDPSPAAQGLPQEQRDFLATRFEPLLREQPEFAKLRKVLLGIGGAEVVPRPEPDLENILSRGVSFPGEAAVLQPGVPSQAHQHVARLWKAGAGRIRIATGWALSNDGLCRQHSWGVNDQTPIETTERRRIYFGYILSESEAKQFWSAENR